MGVRSDSLRFDAQRYDAQRCDSRRHDRRRRDTPRFDVRRLAVWSVLVVLALIFARQATDPGPELEVLRIREAQLRHRFDTACAAKAAASLTSTADDGQPDGVDPWEAVCTAEQLRQVQNRINELESGWWW